MKQQKTSRILQNKIITVLKLMKAGKRKKGKKEKTRFKNQDDKSVPKIK